MEKVWNFSFLTKVYRALTTRTDLRYSLLLWTMLYLFLCIFCWRLNTTLKEFWSCLVEQFVSRKQGKQPPFLYNMQEKKSSALGRKINCLSNTMTRFFGGGKKKAKPKTKIPVYVLGRWHWQSTDAGQYNRIQPCIFWSSVVESRKAEQEDWRPLVFYLWLSNQTLHWGLRWLTKWIKAATKEDKSPVWPFWKQRSGHAVPGIVKSLLPDEGEARAVLFLGLGYKILCS